MVEPGEVLVYKVLDYAFSAVAAGIERQIVLDTVQKMEMEGKTRREISAVLRQMRDDAIREAKNA